MLSGVVLHMYGMGYAWDSVMHACMHECMCMYVYVCVYMCMYICVCMCVCMYVCMYVCIYVCMYICIYACMYVCTYDVCTYVCIYGGQTEKGKFSLMLMHIYKSKLRTPFPTGQPLEPFTQLNLVVIGVEV